MQLCFAPGFIRGAESLKAQTGCKTILHLYSKPQSICPSEDMGMKAASKTNVSI
jgi:hypothetical protein